MEPQVGKSKRNARPIKPQERPFCCGKKLPRWLREFLAEFIGTYILIMVGECAGSGYDLTGHMDLHAVAVAWGVAAMVGVALSMHVSGSHLNPAVTLALATVGKLPFKRVPHYFAAQYLGGFCAAFTTFVVYYPSIAHFDGGKRVAWDSANATGGFFSTYPRPWLPIWTPIVDQVVATAFLLLGVQALTHPRTKLPDALHPFILGVLITGTVIAFGYQCGATLNPARDLAPRLFQLVAGYGVDAFKPLHSTYWLTAGILGPYLGGIIGAWAFYIFVHYDDEEDEREKELEKMDKSQKPNV